MTPLLTIGRTALLAILLSASGANADSMSISSPERKLFTRQDAIQSFEFGRRLAQTHMQGLRGAAPFGPRGPLLGASSALTPDPERLALAAGISHEFGNMSRHTGQTGFARCYDTLAKDPLPVLDQALASGTYDPALPVVAAIRAICVSNTTLDRLIARPSAGSGQTPSK